MFKIKDIRIDNNMLHITDKKDNCYSMSLNDDRIANLIPRASNRSRRIQKSIRYYKRYHKVCLLCTIICIVGAIQPMVFMKSYAEFFLVIFGLVGMGAISLAFASKIYIKWLNKYCISNECWQDVLAIMVNENNYVNTRQKINKDLSKIDKITYPKHNNYGKEKFIIDSCTNTNSTYSYKKGNIIQENKIDNPQNIYHYGKTSIIQDDLTKEKVKVYKKY